MTYQFISTTTFLSRTFEIDLLDTKTLCTYIGFKYVMEYLNGKFSMNMLSMRRKYFATLFEPMFRLPMIVAEAYISLGA